IGGHVLRGLGLDAGLVREAEVAEPVEKTGGPGAVRNTAHVGESAGGGWLVRPHLVAGMMPAGVHVHLDVGHAVHQQSVEVFGGPDAVAAITPARTGAERRPGVWGALPR